MTAFYLVTGSPDSSPDGTAPTHPRIPVEVCACGALVVADRLDWHTRAHRASGVVFSVGDFPAMTGGDPDAH